MRRTANKMMQPIEMEELKTGLSILNLQNTARPRVTAMKVKLDTTARVGWAVSSRVSNDSKPSKAKKPKTQKAATA